MIIKYGPYQVPAGQAAVAFSYRPKYNSGGMQFAETRRWDINGMLLNSGGNPYAFTALITGLYNAFSINNQDLYLYQNDGTTPTSHFVQTNSTIGGTRVVDKEFPDAKGAAYVTYYNWRVSIEADFDTGYTGLQSFLEVVEWVGGGPKFVMLETLNGPPQKQFVQDQTPYKATQRGTAVGFKAWPVPPAPLWPQAWHQDQSPITYKTPTRTGPPTNVTYTDWEISWVYSFEDAAPLAGQPNVWTP